MYTKAALVLAFGWHGLVSGNPLPQPVNAPGSSSDTAHLFARPELAIAEAAAENQVMLGSHPNPDIFNSPVRARVQAMSAMQEQQSQTKRREKSGPRSRLGRRDSPSGADAVTNTIFSGVYPVINVTWGNKAGAKTAGQSFLSFIDTGSSDTFSVWNQFRCTGMQGQTQSSTGEVEEEDADFTAGAQKKAPRATYPQSACAFGTLYDTTQGNFTNLTSLEFSISYFPEMESLEGSMGLAPITVGGQTVLQQQVALVEAAQWTGDGVASGLLGLGYPALTAAQYRRTGMPAAAYDPFFTNLARQGINGQSPTASAVFTLAVDRVPRGTPYWAPAGMLALGGLVPSSYYDGNFTTVPIEPPSTLPATSTLHAFYATTVHVVYGPPGTNITSLSAAASSAGSTAGSSAAASIGAANLTASTAYQTIVDSGTSPNFVPSQHAAAINALFDPPAKLNKTLNYYIVDCNAKVPFVAYLIGGTGAGRSPTGGTLMPMDPRDLIVRSLNGLPGYEDVCFSSIADGGSQYTGQQIIGSTWQRGYVVAYDQGRSLLHFAKRRPY